MIIANLFFVKQTHVQIEGIFEIKLEHFENLHR